MNKFDRNTIIMAVLAQDAYINPETGKHYHRDKDNQTVVIDFPDGSPSLELKVVKDIDKPSGFQATIYEDKKTGNVYGAIRGSEQFKDYKADAKILISGSNSQLADALEFERELLELKARNEKKYGHPVGVFVAGHSLGGNLAQQIKYHLRNDPNGKNIEVHTFNAFGGATTEGPHKLPNDPNVPNIFNHVIAGDMVYNVNKHYGPVVRYANPEVMKELKNNSTAVFETFKDVVKVAPGTHGISNFTGSNKNGMNVLRNPAESRALAEQPENRKAIKTYEDTVHESIQVIIEPVKSIMRSAELKPDQNIDKSTPLVIFTAQGMKDSAKKMELANAGDAIQKPMPEQTSLSMQSPSIG